MTAQELRAWREGLGWSVTVAHQRLGLGRRAYDYLEDGVTSAGTPRPEVPLYIELATCELTRREKQRRR
jgi:hypothetical protein